MRTLGRDSTTAHWPGTSARAPEGITKPGLLALVLLVIVLSLAVDYAIRQGWQPASTKEVQVKCPQPPEQQHLAAVVSRSEDGKGWDTHCINIRGKARP